MADEEEQPQPSQEQEQPPPQSRQPRGLGWKVLIPGLFLLGFTLFGMFVLVPLISLTQDKRRTEAGTEATPHPVITDSPAPDRAAAVGEKSLVLAAAKAQLQHRHPSSLIESYKVDYCEGKFAVVTFLIDGKGSAAYLKKEDVWKVMIEGASPPESQLRAAGFPESIAKYPPPCPVGPRD